MLVSLQLSWANDRSCLGKGLPGILPGMEVGPPRQRRQLFSFGTLVGLRFVPACTFNHQLLGGVVSLRKG